MKRKMSFFINDGFVIQAVSIWAVSGKVVLWSKGSPCGIYGGQIGAGTWFFSEYCGLPLAVLYQLFFMLICHRHYIILVSGNIVK